jgi:hypothetical protein
MGIRFYCPNGHKLNVKDFQAGQKGICPFCGVKMQIPLESTRPSSKSNPSEGDEDTEGLVVEPVEKKTPPAPPPVKPKAASGDPLATAGDVAWYVRPSSGGQFGPANSDLMRSWLAEGRISADSLVWRAGWRDWQEAGRVFPQLAPSPPISDLNPVSLDPGPLPVHPHTVYPVKRHTMSQGRKMALIISLALTAVLVVVLIAILCKS